MVAVTLMDAQRDLWQVYWTKYLFVIGDVRKIQPEGVFSHSKSVFSKLIEKVFWMQRYFSHRRKYLILKKLLHNILKIF